MRGVDISQLSPFVEQRRLRAQGSIGIICGSGPDAGIDLWRKILKLRRSNLGEQYRGDIDAPQVHIHSIPILGLSMEMGKYAELIWPVLKAAVEQFDKHVRAYSIACNTLHYFTKSLQGIGSAKFVSVQEVVRTELQRRGRKSFALLGASPVMELGQWSPYSALRDEFEIEVADSKRLDNLIYAVKMEGGGSNEIEFEFKKIIDDLSNDLVVIGCTELPLIRTFLTKHTLLDPTSLIANELINAVSDAK